MAVEPTGNTTVNLDQILSDPAIRQAFADAIKNLSELPGRKNDASVQEAERRATAAARETRYATGTILGLAIIILLPVAVLAWHGIISSEAVAFILGGVMGAAFTFVSKYFVAD